MKKTAIVYDPEINEISRKIGAPHADLASDRYVLSLREILIGHLRKYTLPWNEQYAFRH